MCGAVEEVRASLPEDPRQAIRGHDISPMLIRMFQLKNDWAHAETLERALSGCIEWHALDNEPMFKRLRERVGTLC